MKAKSKVFSIMSTTTFLLVLMLSSNAYAETVERDYLIKGMTCAGCVFGVKKAFERAGLKSSQIIEVEHHRPDPENKIGHAKVQFPKEEYKGRETDCKIAKEIKSNPGYQVFWDKADQNPCNF